MYIEFDNKRKRILWKYSAEEEWQSVDAEDMVHIYEEGDEIVTCGECIFFRPENRKKYNISRCENPFGIGHGYVHDTDFCSYGRKNSQLKKEDTERR